jgi:ABC-type transport system involved in multi-copper enzyme maturation permease subunit
MLKLINGEAYRILRKKSLYLYFAVLVAGYALLTFIRSGGFDTESLLKEAELIFTLLPVLVGGVLFSAVYIDDLNSKNLITLVGFGISKTTIVAAKLILMVLFALVIWALTPLLLYAAHAVFGLPATAEVMRFIYALSLKSLLMTIAFSALSSIVVYGLQRAASALVVYILLAFGVISQLVGALLRTEVVSGIVPGLDQHIMTGIADRVFAGLVGFDLPLGAIVEYGVYVFIMLTLAILVFNKKEMEF